MRTVVTVVLILLVALAVSGFFLVGGRPAKPTPTASDATPIDVLRAPVQKKTKGKAAVKFSKDGWDWTITPLAAYELSGVVLGCTSYSGQGWRGTVAPYDVAMGWDALAKNDYYRKLSWSQSGRWYYWHYDGSFPHDNNWIIPRSSNNHIIPATDNVIRAIASLRQGVQTRLKGMLVRVDGQRGTAKCWWPSSLSRTDKGDGSCEVFYVTQVKIGSNVYE